MAQFGQFDVTVPGAERPSYWRLVAQKGWCVRHLTRLYSTSRSGRSVVDPAVKPVSRRAPLADAQHPRQNAISTTNAISIAALFSNKPEPLLWLSGVNLRPKSPRL